MLKKSVALALVVLLSPVNVFAEVTAEALARVRSELATSATLTTQFSSAASSVVLVAGQAPVQPAATACDSSRAQGREHAQARHGTAGWLLGGVGLGVALGLIGTGIITGASALSSAQPKDVPGGLDEACYRDGYRSKAKSKNVVSSVLGGLLGTAVWVGIYVASQDDGYSY